MDRLLRVIFWIALVLTLVGWVREDRFVEHPLLPPPLAADPVQEPVSQPGFEVSYRDVAYEVRPKYLYELHGLLVSYRYHDGDRSLHRLWNDHLNVADLCVVWGRNLEALDLNRFKFRNGQFTCEYSTRDQQAWEAFDHHQLSNNHLITADEDLRRRITSVRVGDLVRVRGRLADYGNAGKPERFMRRTSTTRTDTGNGACETIYVDDFQVLRSMPNPWRRAVTLGGWAAALSGGLWLLGVATGRLGPGRRV